MEILNIAQDLKQVTHQNRCLHGKKGVISDILFNNTKIDIFFLSEILISPDVFDPTIRGFDFELKRRSSGNAGGVVGAYIKNGIPYTRRVGLETDDLEFIRLEINFKNCKSFVVGVLNRLQDSSKYSNKNFLKSLSDVFNKLSYKDKKTILMGYISCDYLKDNDHREIKNLFVSYGYKQLIENATRIIETSETLIDVILTNSPETIRNYDTILSSNSDHDIIAIIRKKFRTSKDFKISPKNNLLSQLQKL